MADTEERKYIVVRTSDIEAYLNHLRGEGRSGVTLRKYHRVLYKLYNFIPEGHHLYPDSFLGMLSEVRDQYSVSTINSAISAYNNLMKFMGHAEFAVEHLPPSELPQPQLSREEYFSLLRAAGRTGQRQGYLLVKLFGNLDLMVRDLGLVTVEAVTEGVVETPDDRRVWVPALLRRELLDYAAVKGIHRGPIFCTGSGRVLDRVRACSIIAALGDAANLGEGKANPRCLRKLAQETMGRVRERFEPIIRQTYDGLLESERIDIDWE